MGCLSRDIRPRAPASVALTAALIDALSTDSIDAIVAAIGTMRAALEREGAAADDVVVLLKEQFTARRVTHEAITTTAATTNTT